MAERGFREGLEIAIVAGILLVLAPMAVADRERAEPKGFRHSSSTIYVDDRTSTRWPVRSVAKRWSDATDVTLRVGTCRKDAPCIRIREARIGPGKARRAPWAVTQRSEGKVTGATIRVNNATDAGVARRRSIVCREIGHALGLSDRSSRSTCMSTHPRAASIPGTADIAEINRRY